MAQGGIVRHSRVRFDSTPESTVVVCSCGWRIVAFTRARAMGFYLAHQSGAPTPAKLHRVNLP